MVKRNFGIVMAGLIAVSALVLGIYASIFHFGGGPQQGGWGAMVSATVLPGPKSLVPFRLTDQNGEAFSERSLEGRWSFLFFGYTYCPDICPTTLATLSLMEKKLQSSGVAAPHQVVFVSIDPDRDTPARLAEYVPYFNPSFVGVTGPEEELAGLTRQLGILYARAESQDISTDNYLMDHSAAILLIDPEGRFHAVFSAPHDPLKMAEDFARISSS